MPPKKDNSINQKMSYFKYADYVSSKIEKLTNVTYIVTNFLKDKEPVKWQLREVSLGMLTDIKKTTNREFSPSGLNPVLNYLQSRIQDLEVLLGVAVTESPATATNFSILREEYRALRQFIDERLLAVSGEFLPEPKKEEAGDNRPVSQKTLSSKGHNQPRLREIGAENRGAGRAELIIGFIRQHGWSAIKDVAEAVPDCSLKTIQRELVDLVAQKVLQKKGERRWSRYQLA